MQPIEVSDDIFKMMLNSLPEYMIKHQIFKGPTPDIGDLETIVSWKPETTENRIHSFWRPTDEETIAIVAGAPIELTIWSQHLNPIALQVWG